MRVEARLGCFNPCCFGLAVLAKIGAQLALMNWMFQSLLFWISRFGPSARSPFSPHLWGFNPCCFGLAVLAILGLLHPIDGAVSILVVLD